jgi:hypothetical protein
MLTDRISMEALNFPMSGNIKIITTTHSEIHEMKLLDNLSLIKLMLLYKNTPINIPKNALVIPPKKDIKLKLNPVSKRPFLNAPTTMIAHESNVKYLIVEFLTICVSAA